jgi:hypothetical protein
MWGFSSTAVRSRGKEASVSEPQDQPATLSDDDIETRLVGRTAAYAGDDGDTGDDTGDTSDTSDTGDDSGDTSDSGDDSGDDS